MEWSAAYAKEHSPAMQDIRSFVDNALFDALCDHMHSAYAAAPRIEYSSCSMQRGWNVKYKKRGRALCTLYPAHGYFRALICIGERERVLAELAIPGCGGYVQELFHRTEYFNGSKWLMLDVQDAVTLSDLKTLIQLRAG